MLGNEQYKSKYVNLIWAGLILSSVILIVTVDFLMSALSSERLLISKEAEYIDLGNKFSKSVENLSKQARRFVVTTEDSEYRLYIDEINVKQSREKSINILKNRSISTAEAEKLNLAKAHSDKLIDIEKTSIFLALASLEKHSNGLMKPDLMKLDNNQKLNEARKLIFSKEYEQIKQKFVVNMLEFQQLMTIRMTKETAEANRYTSYIMLAVIAFSTLIILLVISLVWIKFNSRKSD